MATFKQKKYTSKSGKEYTFQHPGIRAVSKINDSSRNKFGVVMEEKMGDEMLRLVIVNPKMKIDDFKDYKEFVEVVNKAYAWISGQEDEDDDQQTGGAGESEA
ncbi:hypothetical protein GNQ08_20590 [Paenibacillus macerans]|uniref:Uncharacterized protein n=1 Tax=Paenibacillus macerans TaxID=44252 RepID=A0A6N8F0Y2_PAEMA|nr:hypothetical protein [Paenibacillus macerans]MUG24770.1 hypothetical protein [Paenibacillus macerans]